MANSSKVNSDLARRLGEAPTFSRFEILEQLGEGATAVVYRAKDRQLDRLVALKVPETSRACRTSADSGFTGKRGPSPRSPTPIS